jgi:hypothetical protein
MKTDQPIDAVRLMRELRDRLDRDVAELSPEQRRDYIRTSAEQVRRDLALPDYADAASAPRRQAL